MIAEKIAITVVSQGKQYRKVTTIVSDGAYHNVVAAVNTYVAKAWAGIQVDLITWSYAQWPKALPYKGLRRGPAPNSLRHQYLRHINSCLYVYMTSVQKYLEKISKIFRNCVD